MGPVGQSADSQYAQYAARNHIALIVHSLQRHPRTIEKITNLGQGGTQLIVYLVSGGTHDMIDITEALFKTTTNSFQVLIDVPPGGTNQNRTTSLKRDTIVTIKAFVFHLPHPGPSNKITDSIALFTLKAELIIVS